MTGMAQAGVGYLALAGSGAVFLVRWAVTGGSPARHRAGRVRRVEEWVPAYQLVPARSLFAHCPPCGAEVPVIVHDRAHRCDHGHITINTTTGSTR